MKRIRIRIEKVLSFLGKVFRKLYSFIHPFIFLVIRKTAFKFPKQVLFFIPEKIRLEYVDSALIQNKKGYLRTLILSAESAIYNSLPDKEKTQNSRKAWENIQGLNWFYKDLKRSSIDSLLKNRSDLIKMIDLYIQSNQEIRNICEIGTGDGRFLDYMQKRYSNIDRFIGIDLNHKIIKRNKEYYSKSNLIFIEGHISEKLVKILEITNNEPILLVTSRTLTWLTQSELEHLLELTKRISIKISLAFFEQNDINMKREYISRVRDDIYFMSHNYPYLLKKSGWNILSQKINFNSRILNDYGINILATNRF